MGMVLASLKIAICIRIIANLKLKVAIFIRPQERLPRRLSGGPWDRTREKPYSGYGLRYGQQAWLVGVQQTPHLTTHNGTQIYIHKDVIKNTSLVTSNRIP